VSLDIGSFTDAIHVPVGTTAQRPSSPAAGYFRYNSTTGGFEGYTDAWGAIAGSGGSGVSGSSVDQNTYTGDGSTTAFTLAEAPTGEDNTIVFIDGVYQDDSTYSVSGTTLTFSTAPANSRVITAYTITSGIIGTTPSVDTMTGDGSDTTLTLSISPASENATFVTIDGVVQHKDTYSVSGTTLTFSAAPPNGSAVECISFANTTTTDIKIIQDADEDTKIQVEESSDEDKIRFDTGGTERMVIDSTGVGIGVAPTHNFNLQGTGTVEARFRSTDGDCSLQISSDTDEGQDSILEFTSGTSGRGRIVYDHNTTAASQKMNFVVGDVGTTAMTILGDGKTGLGTSSPSTLFQLESASTTAMTIQAGTNSSASLRLKNDAVDWDVNCQTNDNFAIYSHTASAERFVINGSGEVAIGATAASPFLLNVGSTGNDSYRPVALSVGSTSGRTQISFNNANGAVGSIVSNGSATSYGTSSDYRLKENVVTDWDATTRLKQLKPSRFNFIADADTTVDGFLAHEVSDIVPEAITGIKDETETLSNVVLSSDNKVIKQDISEDDWIANKVDTLWTEEDELPDGVSVGDVRIKATYPSNSTWEASHTRPVYQGIDQSKLVPLLVKTIQELEARITTLENA
jgi:hypothetical protein